MLTQAEIMEILLPILEKEGKRYQKFKKVKARRAKEGEVIETITSDGLETRNTAGSNHFVIQNLTEANEEYIIPAEKFHKRYDLLEESSDGNHLYQAKGEIVALEMTVRHLQEFNLGAPFHFVAPWGEAMIARQDDFLASPSGYTEIYRIARKEFFETYRLTSSE